MTTLAALSPNSDFVTACYIVAFSLFIFGIRQGTHPRTARRGNLIAAAGMLVAIAITLSTGRDRQWRPDPDRDPDRDRRGGGRLLSACR